MNVVVFGAHPDDAVFMCGGTLAKYAQAGHRVAMAVFCLGLCRPEAASGEQQRVGEEELHRCADLIGATPYIYGCPDLGLEADANARLWVIETMRRVRPDVVLVHDPADYILEHRLTAQLVDGAAIEAGQPELKTDSPPCSELATVYYMETISGLGFTPSEYVDISDVFEVKRRLLACHESQISPYEGHPVVDMMEWIEVAARFRGIQAGVRYAEAFRRAPLWGRMEVKRLLP
jgi:LmbE family N-acetylglucosaminyl deacetylase